MTSEADVARAAASALGAPVPGVERLTRGGINHVYKLKTAEGFAHTRELLLRLLDAPPPAVAR
ncbi:MAG TPA: hypothetical protein VG148_09385 [Pyrinomonadaceae bacterium]|nr:hypothetical protein [Pyrinomonadaceae bacterium]